MDRAKLFLNEGRKILVENVIASLKGMPLRFIIIADFDIFPIIFPFKVVLFVHKNRITLNLVSVNQIQETRQLSLAQLSRTVGRL